MIDRPALVHSLLKYKYLFQKTSSDEKNGIPMTDMDKPIDEDKKEEKPPKKKPLDVSLNRQILIYMCYYIVTPCRVLQYALVGYILLSILHL